MEFKKMDLILETDKSEESITKKVLSKLKNIKTRAQSEIKETRALVRILTHAVRSYAKTREFDLDEKDKEFIKGQSKDVIKNIVLMVVAIIPLPIPLTPFLIIFGKKIGIDLVPQEQEIPDKGKKKEPIDEVLKFKTKGFNILLTEQQYKLILEERENEKGLIYKLCKTQKENGPFCKLYDLKKDLTEDDNVDLDVAIEILNDYFRFKSRGMLPTIVELALQDYGRTVSYLQLIADFVSDDTFDKTKVKKALNRQRNTDKLPRNFDDILKKARELEHQKYESSFIGDDFSGASTFLRLNYKCGDDTKETLFDILTKVKSEEYAIDAVYSSITKCIETSLESGSYYLKADIQATSDLVYSGETIYPSGTYFEVKKMDPFIDSYLSEFFSIFKESELKLFKGEYVDLYNELIQRIFEWLVNTNLAKQYLEKVKSQIGGIMYENNTIVPIKYIDLYWSNKGQRGCNEKRLSIRFRIKKDVDSIDTYRYLGDQQLEKVVKNNIPYKDKELVFCS
jgi:hypothetical protein